MLRNLRKLRRRMRMTLAGVNSISLTTERLAAAAAGFVLAAILRPARRREAAGASSAALNKKLLAWGESEYA
jgi:hypothetical protein